MSDTTLPEDHVELPEAPILTPDHVLPDLATVIDATPPEQVELVPSEPANVASETAAASPAAEAVAESPVVESPTENQAVETPAGEAATASATAAKPAVAKGEKKAPAKGARSRGGAKNSKESKDRDDRNAAYRPADVLQRLNERPGVQRAYLSEAHSLLYHVRLVGLGPALAMLLSQHDHKSKRRIYWDISKWVFKEERIKGKNVRSLMESVVYGEPRFLIKATQSVVSYLEELVKLGQQEASQPARSKSND